MRARERLAAADVEEACAEIRNSRRLSQPRWPEPGNVTHDVISEMDARDFVLKVGALALQ